MNIQIEDALDGGAQHKQIEQHIKEVFRSIEEYEIATEWDRECSKLRNSLMDLSITVACRKEDPGVVRMLENFEAQVDRAVVQRDVLKARTLRNQIETYDYSLTKDQMYRNYIKWVYDDFSVLKWTFPQAAQRLVSKAKAILKKDPAAPLSKTMDIVKEIDAMLVSDKTGSESGARKIDLPSM